MLRALTLERSQIKDAMGFALDNVDAAGEVLPDISAFCFHYLFHTLFDRFSAPLSVVLHQSHKQHFLRSCYVFFATSLQIVSPRPANEML
jgi:hypothetical protein